MNSSRRRVLVWIIFVGLLIFAACAGPEPTSTPPPPTLTITPQIIPAQFTATPSPYVSNTPTLTPTPTITPSATLTPTSARTAFPTNTPRPTNTPQPVPVALAADITVGLEPQDIVFAGGFLWVAHPSGEIYVLTPEGTHLTTSQTTGGVVALTTDGTRVWVAHRGGNITQLEAGSGAISARWTLNCDHCLVRGLHWDGDALWASNFADATLTKINTTNGAMATVPAETASPTSMSSVAGGLLVLHQNLGIEEVVLSRHDITSGAMTASLVASVFPTALLSDGPDAWLASREQEEGYLAHYDPVTLAETWRIPAAAINDLLLASGSLWSADFATNTVTQRNPETGEVLDVFPVGDLPQALAYDGTHLWIVNRRGNSLSRIWIGP